MRKRKIISSILAMSCLLGASGGNAFALNLKGTGEDVSGTITIRKVVGVSYTVVIPDTIDIPNYDEIHGKEIPINFIENSHIGYNKVVNVTLGNFDEDYTFSSILLQSSDNPKDDEDITKFAIYAPIRFTDKEKGGEYPLNLENPEDFLNDSLIESSTDTTVASFDYERNNSIGKKLYVYRAYRLCDGILENFDDTSKVPAGSYEYKLNFKLTYADKAAQAAQA